MVKRHRYKERGDSIVLYPDNYLNDIEGERIEEMCAHFLSQGFREIVMDFSSTDLINSIGVSILIGVIETIRGSGGSVAFCGLSKVNMEIFSIVGLTRQVRIFKDEEEAFGWVEAKERTRF